MHWIIGLLYIIVEFRDESIDIVRGYDHPDGFESLLIFSMSPKLEPDKSNENDDKGYDKYRYI